MLIFILHFLCSEKYLDIIIKKFYIFFSIIFPIPNFFHCPNCLESLVSDWPTGRSLFVQWFFAVFGVGGGIGTPLGQILTDFTDMRKKEKSGKLNTNKSHSFYINIPENIKNRRHYQCDGRRNLF